MNETKSGCQRLSGSTLKRIACISMLIDHSAFLLIGYGVLNTISPDMPAYHMWLQLYHIMRCIGRIAFPIYVFLLTEGIVHTSNWKRYAIRLGIFAVLSELPFDWMCAEQSSMWESQNVFFTLLIGLLTIKSAEFMCSKAEKASEGFRLFLWLAAAAAGCLAAELMKTDYGYIGVILAVLLYIESPTPIRQHKFRDASCARQTFICGGVPDAGHMQAYIESPTPDRRHEFRDAPCARQTFMCGGVPDVGHMQAYLYRKDRKKQCILGFLWKFCHVGRISYAWGIAAAFLLIYAYSGRKGRSAGKYLFYWFYPAHILLLCILYQILFV